MWGSVCKVVDLEIHASTMLRLHSGEGRPMSTVIVGTAAAHQVMEPSLPCAADVHAWPLPYRVQAF